MVMKAIFIQNFLRLWLTNSMNFVGSISKFKLNSKDEKISKIIIEYLCEIAIERIKVKK